MAKIPPQSEPVDYRDLYKRLEIVAKQREATDRSSRDLYSSKNGSGVSQSNHDSTSSAGSIDKSPPPPTAQATRPVSSMPSMPSVLTQSYKNRFSRLSMRTAPSSEQTKRLSLRSEIGAFRPLSAHEKHASKGLSTVATSEPGAAQNDEDAFVHVRGRSGSGTSDTRSERKSASSRPNFAAENAPIVKRGSSRQVRVVSHSFRAAEHHDSQSMVAPVSNGSEGFTSPSLSAPPSKHFSLDGTDAGLSDISTATTEVAAHSTSSSRSDRKSWNQKSIGPRHRDKNSGTVEVVAVPLLNHSLVSSAPPVHDLIIATITSSQDAPADVPASATNWDRPIPRPPQPQATSVEPFRFHDYTFSHGSDMSSHRASDTHTFFFSDLDSGIGLSDSGSAAGADEMPTLMNGAERRPDWNKSDPNLAAKRDSQFGIPQTIDSPVRKPYRESLLRTQVSANEAFEFHPDLALQEEPPEDEGIVVNFDSRQLAPLPYETEHSKQAATSSNAHEDPSSDPEKAKRRTFDPRQLFSAPKLFSQKRNSTFMTTGKPNRLTFTGGLNTGPTSTRSARPPSRSQPIVILPRHQIIPEQRQPRIASFSMPMQSLPHLPSTDVSAQSNSSAPSRPRTADHIPIIPKIPPIPAFEIAHMTPQSLALLREQEKVIARRSTLSMSPADQEAYYQANSNANMIGVAFSSDASFVRPPVPPIPDSIPIPRMSLNAKPSVEFLKAKNAASAAADDNDGSASMSFSKPGRVRRLPPAAKSMLELHNVDVNSASAAGDRFRSDGGRGRKKWWKVWHRN